MSLSSYRHTNPIYWNDAVLFFHLQLYDQLRYHSAV